MLTRRAHTGAMIFPFRHRSIFKSRWIALFWAAGIVWSAVEFAGGQPGATPANTTDNGETADAAATGNDAAPLSAADFSDTKALVDKLNAMK
ncbi:MAG: hypothetical protein JWO65_2360 [Sphingomonas bacterium]|jgi:hypothetical protein|nr:hypothetical protein [Sphingomonas bacterium]